MWERGSKYNNGSSELHARFSRRFIMMMIMMMMMMIIIIIKRPW